MKPLVIITGVGPGTGSAMARRFHDGGYKVAMLARTAERLADLESELPNAFAVPCDVADPVALAAALEGIEQRAGAPKVVIHNAVGGAFGNFLDIEPEVLQQNFQINVMALLHLARWAAPRMEAAGGGALLLTGNTSAFRGKAGFAGFAPTKAARGRHPYLHRTAQQYPEALQMDQVHRPDLGFRQTLLPQCPADFMWRTLDSRD